MSFVYEKRLRNKPRGRTILLVGIVRPVGVEVKLAIVPVEDRSVHELTVAIGILLLSIRYHQKLRFTFAKGKLYSLFPEFYSGAVFEKHLHQTKASSISSG